MYLFLSYYVWTRDNFTTEKIKTIHRSVTTQTSTEYIFVVNKTTDVSLFPKKCQEKHKNVVFLKVHKAGSTTVMNILLRFATHNKLNVVLPNTTPVNLLSYPGHKLLPENLIAPPVNETYNILCNHAIYDRPRMESIMPNDSMYIGIVREPTSRFISASFYYRFYVQLQEELPHLANNTEELFRAYFRDPKKFKHLTFERYFVFNSMAFDFGFSRDIKNATVIGNKIAQLEKEFKLVMLMEYFEESLVLMKRYLCWELKDIIYIPANRRPRNRDIKPIFNLNDFETIKELNNIDVAIYQHFKNVFLRKVGEEGPLFQEEVKQYKQIIKGIVIFCRKRAPFSNHTVEASIWNEEFQVPYDLCVRMKRFEINTMNTVKEMALEKLKLSQSKK